MSARPTFSPVPHYPDDCNALRSKNQDEWIPILSCAASFPLDLFVVAAEQMVQHPEYNSTLILRSETLSETSTDSGDLLGNLPCIEGMLPMKNIHRKLLPRRPCRDAPIEQHCTFYCNSTKPSKFTEESDIPSPSCLILSPIIQPGETMPYYHPTVAHLAVRYLRSLEEPGVHESSADLAKCSIGIEVIPLAGTPDPTEPNSRVYRTCLALLDTIHRYGWGALTNYKKRVVHDSLVTRETYQDLYLILRERHKYLVNQWKESTDPLKHVFEDIGIATFLMLLWKETYGPENGQTSVIDDSGHDGDTAPWRTWPRPPGGFIDLGCGNGLLTHILTSEGYSGTGIDVRARISWAHYPEASQANLKVVAFDPMSFPSDKDNELFLPGAFIIANHADELTPWTPVLATLSSASGYLSIPCCAWSFESKFERSQSTSSGSNVFHVSFKDTPQEFIDELRLGGDGSNKSSYSMYRIWLAYLSADCGWEIECETLRIPSTRNWAIVGTTFIAISALNTD